MRKYIFIGDSYGTSTSENGGWISTLANLVGITKNVDYYSSSIIGAGFIAGSTFLSQITNLGSSITDKSSITDIVVCGGWNDTTTLNTIDAEKNAISEFVDYCHTNYPNATVRIGYIGWARLNTSTMEEYRDRLYYKTSEIIEAFQTTDADYVYLNGVENVLSSSLTYILNGNNPNTGDVDYLHATDTGTKMVAKKIWEAIQIGSCDITVGTRKIPVTYAVGVSGNPNLEVYTTVKGGMRQVYFSYFDLTIPSLSCKGNGKEGIHIATLDTTQFASFNGATNTCKIFAPDSYIISAGTALAGTLTLWIENGGKVMLGFKPTMTVNDTITITKAYMCSSHQVTVPLIQT